MSFSRGDVVLVLFPDSNLRTAKRRPALVVQADNLGTGLQQTLVAMITSNMARTGHLSRVEVRQASPLGQQMGLRTDSVIMTVTKATEPRTRAAATDRSTHGTAQHQNQRSRQERR